MRREKGATRIAGAGIQVLEAKEREIKKRLKELRRQKRAAAYAAHRRKLLTVENTEVDEERADRLAKFAQTDKDQAEAKKIQRLLQERKKLLGYLTPSKLATKSGDDSFQKRLSSLPFSVAGETDCVASCKQARSATKRQPVKKAVKTHMLPTSADPPFVYQGGHDDCDAGGMMIMPPDFPVRVVNKGDCATCSAVCSTMKFSSPWMRDRRGSCGVRAESDTLDRYMRNFNGEVTMNLCTPLKGGYRYRRVYPRVACLLPSRIALLPCPSGCMSKSEPREARFRMPVAVSGYGDFLTGEPTVNGFNGDVGYIGGFANVLHVCVGVVDLVWARGVWARRMCCVVGLVEARGVCLVCSHVRMRHAMHAPSCACGLWY